MASRFGFRQHIMLILFLDLFVILFVGLGTKSFLGNFISSDLDKMTIIGSVGIGAVITSIFVGISSIGVTSGSNFAGVTGIISGFMGKALGGGKLYWGSILLIVVDYGLIFNAIVSGAGNDWTGFWFHFIAILIFFPLVVDALFAAIDWSRGVVT